jgi:hypothetical protein
LAGDDFGGAEVDIFDDAAVVEEDVCGMISKGDGLRYVGSGTHSQV